MTAADEDLDLYRSTVTALLRAAAPGALVAELVAQGWAGLADDDPATAVGVLFEEQGRARVASRALDLVVARAVGAPTEDAGGGLVVVHPTSAAPPGRPGTAGGLVVAGVVLAGASGTAALVPLASGAVTVPFARLTTTPVDGLDPAIGLVSVAADEAEAQAHVGRAVPWDDVVAAARRALSHELVGVADAMLEVAVGQVIDRHQFGRPVGAFQAVKHRLADARVALDAARAGLAAAWRQPESRTAAMAKVLAGRAALLAAKHAQQVCGAIGFTTEHPLPGLVRRAYVLDALYGPAALLQEELGQALLAERAAPRLRPSW